jgi:hypothetical protein
MFQWILENGEKVGIVTIVLVIGFGFLFAWVKEWIFLGTTVRRIIEDKDKEIQRANERIALSDARSERLLLQLERTVNVTEKLAVRQSDADHRTKRTRAIDLPEPERE